MDATRLVVLEPGNSWFMVIVFNLYSHLILNVFLLVSSGHETIDRAFMMLCLLILHVIWLCCAFLRHVIVLIDNGVLVC